MTDGCKACASACKARKLNHRAVNHYKMEFVKKDKKPAKGQSKLLGTQKIDRLWQDLKGFLGSKVTSKKNAKEMNPRLKTYVFAYMFRRNEYETGKLCKWREKKRERLSLLSRKWPFRYGKTLISFQCLVWSWRCPLRFQVECFTPLPLWTSRVGILIATWPTRVLWKQCSPFEQFRDFECFGTWARVQLR